MSNTKLKNKEFDIKKVNIGNVPENEDTFIPLQNNHGNNLKILNSGVKENYPNKMNISMKALVNYYETMEKVGKKKGIMFHDPNRAGFTSPSGIKYNKAVPNIDSSNNRRPGLALGYLGDRNHTKKITPISKFQPYTNIIKNNQNENSNSNDCMSSVKKKVEYYLSDNIQVALMSIATLFALFGLDLKIMYLNPIYDEFFNYALITVAVIFFLELFASIWVKEGYIKSFFFWLDLFASISMIFEIDSLLYSTLGFILRYILSIIYLIKLKMF